MKDRSRAAAAGTVPAGQRTALWLFVAGMTPRSSLALANIREICESHMAGLYDLKVIDLYQQPILASGEQIIALPTLIRKRPAPLRRLVGDLSNRGRVLAALDLKQEP